MCHPLSTHQARPTELALADHGAGSSETRGRVSAGIICQRVTRRLEIRNSQLSGIAKAFPCVSVVPRMRVAGKFISLSVLIIFGQLPAAGHRAIGRRCPVEMSVITG
jgi:hypothetical protein